MIKKTLLFCLLLSVVYTLIWKLGDIKNADPQEVWQENQIKAQDFLYNTDTHPENIIVGSSISCFIPADSLPNFYNLSLRGETVYAGMKIIVAKGIYPKRLFIEANILNKLESTAPVFNEVFYNPVLSRVRSRVPILRDGKQPLLKLGTTVDSLLIGRCAPKFSLYDRTIFVDGSMTDSAFVMGRVGHYYLPNFTTEEQKATYELLKHYVDIFNEKDVEIVFFYVPFNKYMWNLPFLCDMRSWLTTRFPPGKDIKYMEMYDVNSYLTYDGIHLTHEEAQRYTTFFKKQSEQLINSQKAR